MRERLTGIYGIINEGGPDPIALTRALLEGGVKIFQYRAKAGIVFEHVVKLREMTRAHEALFIINDDWRTALDVDADGAHLGPEDADAHALGKIRKHLSGKVLGYSAGTQDEARFARSVEADYLGVGSVFATISKSDAGKPIGIEGLRRVAAATELPVCAIGGINPGNLGEVLETGVPMAAILSSFAHAENPTAIAQRSVHIWSGA